MRKKGILILTALLGIWLTSCLNSEDPYIPNAADEKADLQSYLSALAQKGNNIDTTAMGNYYVVINQGEGVKAKAGDTLTIGYAGYFVDGSIFDASEWHNQNDGTYQFVLGSPALIKGWDEGMTLLNKNAKIQLIIPSENAYGSSGAGIIPPYATLVFVVKLIDIKYKN